MANVWKQLFHETIPNLAYTANTIGQSRFGVENIVSSLFKNGLTLHWHPGRDHPAGGAARRTRTTSASWKTRNRAGERRRGTGAGYRQQAGCAAQHPCRTDRGRAVWTGCWAEQFVKAGYKYVFAGISPSGELGVREARWLPG